MSQYTKAVLAVVAPIVFLLLVGCAGSDVRTVSAANSIANGKPSIFVYRERIIGGMAGRYEVNANGISQRLKIGEIAVLPMIDGANIVFVKPVDINRSQPAMTQVTSNGKVSKYLVVQQVFNGAELREVPKNEWESLVNAKKLTIF